MSVIFYRKPALRNPTMIAGLPGMGLVAKQVVDYFIRKLDAELIGEMPRIYPPTSVIIFNKGLLVPIPDVSYRFYYWRGVEGDFLFFTGNQQPSLPEEQHRVAEQVVKVAQDLDVKRMYTAAAMAVYRYTDNPRVYAVATKPELLRELKEYGVETMAGEGTISGLNGLLIGYSRKMGIEGICLLSETYLIDSVDVKAALAIIRKLTEITGVKLDLSEVEEVARRVSEEIKRVLRKPKPKEEKRERLGYIS